ncbi:MAG: hypothetical protein JWM64_1772, partial [Frankiales bacterium]|nr:hypothetical protein [Frankiales bacterium]
MDPNDARTPPSRPVLLPGLRRLWRDAESLQLGRSPGALVLVGIDEPVRRTLALLDGTRDAARLEADAQQAGLEPGQTAELVALLHGAGVLEDAACALPELQALPREERDRLAPDLSALSLLTGGQPAVAMGRRQRARVQVVGAGRVGTTLATVLVAAGVGTVDVVDEGTTRPGDVGPAGPTPADVGRCRGEA